MFVINYLITFGVSFTILNGTNIYLILLYLDCCLLHCKNINYCIGDLQLFYRFCSLSLVRQIRGFRESSRDSLIKTIIDYKNFYVCMYTNDNNLFLQNNKWSFS